MSRRRTTKKLYRASTAVDEKPVATATAVLDSADPGSEPGPQPAPAAEPGISAETLDRLLAAEAAEREVGEQRTANLFARYFKLTVAMVCLNMVVAGANVAMLFRHPREIRTIVPTAAPATLPEPIAKLPAAPPPSVAQPAAPIADPQLATAAPAQPLLGSSKTPLLGTPAASTAARPLVGRSMPSRKARADKATAAGNSDPDARRSNAAPEPTRAVATPSRGGSVLTAKLADDDRESSRFAERW